MSAEVGQFALILALLLALVQVGVSQALTHALASLGLGAGSASLAQSA